MRIPGGPEVFLVPALFLLAFLVPALFLLAFLGLAGKYVLKWIREGYEEEVAEEQPE